MVAMRGFTIVEMIVAIGVLCIVIALAGPAMSGMITTQQVRSASQDVYASLTIARSEALTRNTSVTVEPLLGDWAKGWTVTDAGGTVLRRQDAYPRITLSGPARVVFNGDGRPDSIATPFSFAASNLDTPNHRCVRLRLNGRSSISSGGC
jgi:type IV fimbrial biogenesis protein FimT